MTTWTAILLGSVLVYSWKYLGYIIPSKLVGSPKVQEMATLLTVALLGALVGIQSFGSANGISFDARIPALLVSAVLYFLRVPFIVVVCIAAAIAAGIRFLI